jgi:3-oxoacyl-[acyl-carrier protein] reductase
VETDMLSQFSKEEKEALCEDIPLGRFAHPSEIAKSIFDIYNTEYMTGQLISLNGGMVI